MYDLSYHKENNPEIVEAFMQENPFAFLSGCNSNQRVVATQVPLLLEKRKDKIYLMGHIMKNTDHHKAFMHNAHVLAVFSGKHSYVSGSWYSNPHTPSTWNYSSVHVRGRIQFLEEKALEEMLRKTSLHFENNNSESPTVFDNLSETYTKKVLQAIIAFEIEVYEIDNVFKLSQDRDKESFDNIIHELNSKGEDERSIAQQMTNRKKDLFD